MKKRVMILSVFTSFIRASDLLPPLEVVPKSVLHLHIEAAMTVPLAQRIAAKNKVTLPDSATDFQKEGSFPTFEPFAKAYFSFCSVLKQPSDFYDVTFDVAQRLAAEGVMYAELIVSPQLMEEDCGQPIDFKEGMQAVEDALEAVERFGRIKLSALLTFIRGNAPDQQQKGQRYLEYLVQHKETLSHYRGIHLSGDETTYPDASQFIPLYQQAHAAGLGRAAHAGEGLTPQHVKNMWDAITFLNVTRIGHGIAAVLDDSLRAELISRKITLEGCPTSNLCLCLVDKYPGHPLQKLMAQGVSVHGYNPDDPFLFNTTPTQEITVQKDNWGFTDEQIQEQTELGISAGFLPEAMKQQLLSRKQAADRSGCILS